MTVRLLRDPLRMGPDEYTLWVQAVLDMAYVQPQRREQIMAALVEAESRWLRVWRPWLYESSSVPHTP